VHQNSLNFDSVLDAKKFKEFFERADQKNPQKISDFFLGSKIFDFRRPRLKIKKIKKNTSIFMLCLKVNVREIE